jgi:hypothetical protein
MPWLLGDLRLVLDHPSYARDRRAFQRVADGIDSGSVVIRTWSCRRPYGCGTNIRDLWTVCRLQVLIGGLHVVCPRSWLQQLVCQSDSLPLLCWSAGRPSTCRRRWYERRYVPA